MASIHTENDILKALVRKGALSEMIKELNAYILSSPSPYESPAKKQDSKEDAQKD